MDKHLFAQLNKVFLGNDNVISDVCIRTQERKGYIKPLFIKDSIPTICRAWSYNKNVVILA